MPPSKQKNRTSLLPVFFGGSHAGNWADRNYKTIVTAFFVAVFILAVCIVRDFGISFDEGTNRLNGFVSLGYIVDLIRPQFYKTHFAGVPVLAQYKDNDYGVFFELPAVIIEYAFRITDETKIAYLHHFLTFTVFFTALIFFYHICKQRFNSWKIGLLGCVMLILSPRIFAQAFYNSKDVVFMSFFLIATYTLLRFLRKADWKSAVWHALACTAAVDTRIMGILMPLLTLFIIGVEVLKVPDIKQQLAKWGKLTAIYLGVFVVFTIMCWPYLWQSPFNNFVTAFHNMSYFRWYNYEFFMGQYITPAKYIPWYYIPVWIVISTPVLYTLLFLTGVAIVVKNVVRAKIRLYSDINGREDLIFLLLFFGPLLAVIVLKSVLYDAWRQMYFIYPAFLLLAISGFVAFYNLVAKRTVLACALIATACISFGFTACFMIRNHPLEDVYFSFLPGKVAEKNFEMDYWGLSYRKGLDYILKNDTSKNILIGYSRFSFISAHILPADQQKRLTILRDDDPRGDSARWMITNFRFDKLPPGKPATEVYAEYVDHMKVMAVYRLPGVAGQ